MKKLIATIAAAGSLLVAAPAGATPAPVALSVRMNGAALIIAVNGVKHTCPTQSSYVGANSAADCANGSSFSYNTVFPVVVVNGHRQMRLTANIGGHHAYVCADPRTVATAHWACTATSK